MPSHLSFPKFLFLLSVCTILFLSLATSLPFPDKGSPLGDTKNLPSSQAKSRSWISKVFSPFSKKSGTRVKSESSSKITSHSSPLKHSSSTKKHTRPIVHDSKKSNSGIEKEKKGLLSFATKAKNHKVAVAGGAATLAVVGTSAYSHFHQKEPKEEDSSSVLCKREAGASCASPLPPTSVELKKTESHPNTLPPPIIPAGTPDQSKKPTSFDKAQTMSTSTSPPETGQPKVNGQVPAPSDHTHGTDQKNLGYQTAHDTSHVQHGKTTTSPLTSSGSGSSDKPNSIPNTQPTSPSTNTQSTSPSTNSPNAPSGDQSGMSPTPPLLPSTATPENTSGSTGDNKNAKVEPAASTKDSTALTDSSSTKKGDSSATTKEQEKHDLEQARMQREEELREEREGLRQQQQEERDAYRDERRMQQIPLASRCGIPSMMGNNGMYGDDMDRYGNGMYGDDMDDRMNFLRKRSVSFLRKRALDTLRKRGIECVAMALAPTAPALLSLATSLKSSSSAVSDDPNTFFGGKKKKDEEVKEKDEEAKEKEEEEAKRPEEEMGHTEDPTTHPEGHAPPAQETFEDFAYREHDDISTSTSTSITDPSEFSVGPSTTESPSTDSLSVISERMSHSPTAPFIKTALVGQANATKEKDASTHHQTSIDRMSVQPL